MKFTPKTLDDNVNVSKAHPLVEFAWLLGGLVLVAGIFFVLLGTAADWATVKVPVNVENWLGEQGLEQFPTVENQALEQQLQPLLEKLPEDSPLHKYNFKIFLSEKDEINAIALPGGNIVVFSGLLKQVESENELAMILGHELGHFAHRDHLRGMGRGLGIAVASVLFFGENNGISELVTNTLLTFQIRYSQSQESSADRFGLELLVKRYGHAAGSTDFFVRNSQKAGSTVPYLLASHPHPKTRIKQLEQIIQEKGYQRRSVKPLPAELRI